MTAPSTPRVAASIDDLRVGQYVTARFKVGSDFEGEWCLPGSITSTDHAADIWRDSDSVVILSDPPLPVTVSREAIDRLATALDEYPDATQFAHPEIFADARIGAFQKVARLARALVDEVRATDE